MVDYVEEFTVLGKRLGIEDMEDTRPGVEHFFPEHATHRYQLWAGGCGVGRANTIQEAREILHDYAIRQARDLADKATRSLEAANAVLKKLGEDPTYLFRFENNDERN